ncbi:acetyltransferase [Desulfotomaculum arcticum]|uniref:Acetyltransferase n=1 Tax=Desulfotruncus arcticus DSM 17038 TaxID=1121424 RepID=A0A1I2QAY2_9FIRM|nr:acetate--CoA ligase family protein [Desulfotruncus arcticus]SFG25494.1 acetyltransferase [Desulfotomaculum arcticum] [Desulfotruncus arcticus DSM 17038]
MTEIINLEPFFSPQSVALIGVSSRTGPGTFNVLEQILNSGYRGKIYPVNPRGGSILGVPAYRSVKDISHSVDLAIISTPRSAVPEVVGQCVEKGITAVIVITQGFSDADDEAGQRMHNEIVEAVRGTATRVVGPNTLGVINNFINFKSAFLEFTTSTVPVGFICQSGIFLAAAKDFTGGIGIGVDIGNTSDVGFIECMEYMAQNPLIKVINLHIEGLQNGRRFMEAARRITPLKPILALKTGSSEEGSRAASSHSGSLAGEDAVFSAAFNQSGIIRVAGASQLAELNRTLWTYGKMAGKRIGVITISGGAGIMAVDACSKYGLQTASYAPETIAVLEEVFPDWMKAGNPADIWPAGMARGYHKIVALALNSVLADSGVDAVLCITPAYLDPAEDPLNIVDTVNETVAKHPDKPTAMWFFGPHKQKYAEKFNEAELVVAYGSPESAMYCLSELYKYHNMIKNKAYETTTLPPTGSVNLKLSTLSAAPVALNEKALDIIESCGIPAVNRRLASSEDEAVKLAGEIGYPVVMKISSPDITHKSDAGGVRLGISSEAELMQAYREMMEIIPQKVPGARIKGVLLQKSVSEGTEVILGGKRDPQFGPVLVFGMGGIYAEIMRDVAFRVAPVTKREAVEMIKETKAYKIISGARGKKTGNIEALAQCIVKLGELLGNQPEITEVDINPLLVKPEGCIALDARMVID